MRKIQQRKIFELLQTLEEAHGELRKLLTGRGAADLLADCWDFAFGIGQFIEGIAGEGTWTVALLEEYREIARRAADAAENGTNAGAGGNSGNTACAAKPTEYLEKLAARLNEIENSVKTELKPNRLEAVFFPYRASMWDSLESIWRAAKEDPDCDAYVVPIPFFDLKPDGSFGKKNYEGGLFPKDVPVTDWKNYDVEARHPDIIYTHYPYDDAARNASVHPDFYSKRLRGHCGLLAHVPYFSSGGVTESYTRLPGVIHAHRVILSLEADRENCVHEYKKFDKMFGWKGQFGEAEKKFIALGSPKIDKLVQTGRETYELPEAWRRLIQKSNGEKKKIILYNTHMFAWLNGGEAYFKKIQSVFDEFRGREDVLLWWRPHPNTELNFRTQRPEWYDAYKEVINTYKQEGFGIYDDTPDLHRAIAMSDAYYGDQSSVRQLYEATGKPVFFQNIDIREIRRGKNEMGIIFRDFVVVDQVIWFVSHDMNALFSMDINSHTVHFAGEIPEEPAFEKAVLASGITVENGNLLFTPGTGKSIVKFDISRGEFERTPLRQESIGNCRQINFIESLSRKGAIYMIPYEYPAFLKYDSNNGIITENKELYAEIVARRTRETEFWHIGNGALNGSHLFFAVGGCNQIVKYNLESGAYAFYPVGRKENHYASVAFDGRDYWLIPRKGCIVKWNEKQGAIAELDIYPNGFRDWGELNFRAWVLFNDDIFLFPAQANMVLKIDTRKDRLEPFINLDKRVSDVRENPQSWKYLCAKRVGGFIYAESVYEYAKSVYEGTMQKINPITAEIENIPICLSDSDYSKIMDRPIFSGARSASDDPFNRLESKLVTLRFFLDRLVSEDPAKRGASFGTERGRSGGKDESPGAAGGFGKKIYEYIKAEMESVESEV